MVKLCIQQTLLSILEVDTNKNATHCNKDLSFFKIFTSRCRKDNFEQMLKFGELSGFEKFETKFYGLDIIIERTVMHEMKKIDRKVLNA